MTKILIFDSYLIFSGSIKSLLQKDGLEVVNDIRTWDDLFGYLKKSVPDLIIVNFIHGSNNNPDLLRELRTAYHAIPLLMITSEDYADFFIEYFLMGINGFILGDTPPGELIKAVRGVLKGEDYYPNPVFKKLKEYLALYQLNPAATRHSHVLTQRETNILRMFCNGKTFKEIASELFISPRTVETHKRNIMAKLKLNNTAEMIQFAFRHQLI